MLAFWRRHRRKPLFRLAIFALVMGSMWFTHSHWGIESDNNHWMECEHPFRIDFVNRFDRPAAFEAWDEDGHLWGRRLLIDRQRDHFDMSAPVGSQVRVRVRLLTLEGSDVEERSIEWTGASQRQYCVTLGEDRQETRTDEARPKVGEGHGMLSVRSHYELPIKVGYELGPGHGRMYMPRARDRDKTTWIGDGFNPSFTGGIGVTDGETVVVPYWIPAVTAECDTLLVVPADGAVEMSVDRDGGIAIGPRTWTAFCAAALGF